MYGEVLKLPGVVFQLQKLDISENGGNGGNRRGTRDAERVYKQFNERQQMADWSYEPAPFDPSQIQSRAPTSRSLKKEPKDEGNTYTPKPDDTAEPARDEPLYDIGLDSSLIPTQDVCCQNFEYSEFILIVNET